MRCRGTVSAVVLLAPLALLASLALLAWLALGREWESGRVGVWEGRMVRNVL